MATIPNKDSPLYSLKDVNTKLLQALLHPLWESHKLGDTYKMDNTSGWKIAYYPIFEDGKTGKEYSEPRALIEKPFILNGEKGTDFREVPLRYLQRI